MIFLDSGAFLGGHLPSDQHYDQARVAWTRLRKTSWSLFTSNHVVDEAATLLARRSSYAFAAQWARELFASQQLQILRSGQEEELEALELFEKFADQKVSFTDCISFAFMRRRRIRRVFGFDRHFLMAGFELWPGDS